LKSYSKYDFVPGEKIIYMEDFGNWLKIQETTKYESAFKGTMPENYTIEFDMIAEFKDNQSVPWLYVRMEDNVKPGHAYGAKYALTLAVNGGNSENGSVADFASHNVDGDRHLDGKSQYFNEFQKYNHKQTPLHIAIWVQKERIRVWANEVKLYDLPKGVPPGMVARHLIFETSSGSTEFEYFISNIRLAAAPPDTRSKLITEGKYTTSGILFDVNSDKIKPNSYAVLKDIASTLSQNAGVRVKIIGHTDNDGDDKKNLDLSKRRAAAVKTALSSEFGIDTDRMETDGAGESKPVADNTKAEGKAQNRRVEFIKL
jgi:flagellar motor protein MotB